MPDARLTGAKNVTVSSAENLRFTSCGAVRPGLDPDDSEMPVVRAQYFCMLEYQYVM